MQSIATRKMLLILIVDMTITFSKKERDRFHRDNSYDAVEALRFDLSTNVNFVEQFKWIEE